MGYCRREDDEHLFEPKTMALRQHSLPQTGPPDLSTDRGAKNS